MRQVADLEPDFSLISDYWQEIIKGCLIKDNKERFSSPDLCNKLRRKPELKNNNISNNINKIKEEKELELLLKQADFLRDLKQYQEAMDLYNQIIQLNPNYSNAYFNRGVAYDDLKEYKKAIADYTKAIELDPNYTYAYYNRGVAYYHLKEYENAILDYTKAIKLDPNFQLAKDNLKIAISQIM